MNETEKLSLRVSRYYKEVEKHRHEVIVKKTTYTSAIIFLAGVIVVSGTEIVGNMIFPYSLVAAILFILLIPLSNKLAEYYVNKNLKHIEFFENKIKECNNKIFEIEEIGKYP